MNIRIELNSTLKVEKYIDLFYSILFIFNCLYTPKCFVMNVRSFIVNNRNL